MTIDLVHGILGVPAAAASSASTVGPAVIVVAVLVGVWMYALGSKGSKGTIPGRLVALLAFGIGAWILLGVTDPAGGTALASGAFRGIGTVLGAIGTVLKGA